MEPLIYLVRATRLISVQKDLTFSQPSSSLFGPQLHGPNSLIPRAFALTASSGVLFLCLLLRAGSCLASREPSSHDGVRCGRLTSVCPCDCSLLPNSHCCLPPLGLLVHLYIVSPAPPPRLGAPGEQGPCQSHSTVSPEPRTMPGTVCPGHVFVEKTSGGTRQPWREARAQVLCLFRGRKCAD